MKIGESFDVDFDEIARSNLYRLARYAGIEVTVSAITDKQTGQKFYRLWRTR